MTDGPEKISSNAESDDDEWPQPVNGDSSEDEEENGQILVHDSKESLLRRSLLLNSCRIWPEGFEIVQESYVAVM